MYKLFLHKENIPVQFKNEPCTPILIHFRPMCLIKLVLVIGTHLRFVHRYQYVDILWFNVIFAVNLFDHCFLNQLFSSFMVLCVYFFLSCILIYLFCDILLKWSLPVSPLWFFCLFSQCILCPYVIIFVHVLKCAKLIN